jgi:hypothetical protein
MEEQQREEEFDFLAKFPIDFAEAFISILIIRAIMDKPIEYWYVTKTSIVLGLLLYLMNVLGNEYKNNIKEGIRNSIGYFIFSQFSV